MTSDHLQRELARFDPALPLAESSTPPASWYTEAEIHGLERETVFRHNWHFAARAEQLGEVGSYACGEVAGKLFVVVRADDGQLRAFHNVCRHRAAAVVEGEGILERFVCPYHGWTYALDGRLLRAPQLGRVKGFDRDASGLVPMAVEEWGPLVFVCTAEKPRSLSHDLQELGARLDATGFLSLRFVTRRSYWLECNWKVFVDNYLDGGYHVPHLHSGLAAQLDLKTYRTETFERFSIQSSASSASQGTGVAGREESATEPADDPGQGDFPARIGTEVLYAWIYPNFMINRYGNIMDTNLVLPHGHDRTQVIFDYYFAQTEDADAAQFIGRSLTASDVVQKEDMKICESVQRGLASPAYDRGPYSTVREAGEHHFHRLLATDLTGTG